VKLNLAESLLVNNPARAWIQRFYEGPLLRRLGGSLDGARVLEIGCGRGEGIRILLEQFGAGQVCAVDLDPRQIQRSRHLWPERGEARVLLAVASAEQLPFPDEHFEAVFDFGMLHHVPRWQTAVAEIRRVLRPSGKLFFEEVTRAALNRWIYRTFFVHPTENRFSEAEFLAELAAQGIQVVVEPRRILRNDIFIGVGERAGVKKITTDYAD
jgi:ubiquinone/menaquinone biosynthesis C-methylase UbiE